MTNEITNEKDKLVKRKKILPIRITIDAGEDCKMCKNGIIVIRNFTSGRYVNKKYLGCNQFPTCNFFQWMQ